MTQLLHAQLFLRYMHRAAARNTDGTLKELCVICRDYMKRRKHNAPN